MARKREFDKDTVLEQAMLLFWKQGFEATSIHDLKKVTGISTSSMYETFGDKRGIFLESLARFCELEQKQLLELAQETSSAIQLIERLFDSLEVIVHNTDENRGSLAFNAMIEFGTRDTDITEMIVSHYYRIAEIIADELHRAQKAEAVITQHNALHLAHLILNTLYGVATVQGAKPDYAYTEAIKQIILSLLTS